MHRLLRYILALAAALAASLPASAETVTQKTAMNIAQAFFNTMYGYGTPRPKLVWNGRELTTNRLFTPFYVYNSTRVGFVAVSADTKAFPILAYSRTQRFDKSQLGDRELDRFTRFAREVELIRYDSRVPERAVRAWAGMPAYLTGVIGNPYDTPDYRRLTDEARDEIEEMDRRNSWIIMPTAVEFDIYNPEQYRDYTLDDVLGEEQEYVPFSFYEDFLSDIAEEERTRAAAYERIQFPADPVVRRIGGGRYSVLLPGEARLMRVYNIAGARTQEKTYSGSNNMSVDLSGMPSGYYIILAMTRDGSIYAFKVNR